MESESVIIITTLLTFVGGIVSWVFLKVVRPTLKFINKHEDLADSVDTIKQEITTNGGGSLKDVVCKLGESCDRIEHGQTIIEQRTKAAARDMLVAADRRAHAMQNALEEARTLLEQSDRNRITLETELSDVSKV